MCPPADLGTEYRLLPFQFMRLKDLTLLVNQAGEFITLSDAEFRRFVDHALGTEEGRFLDLKAKHFATDGSLDLPVQLLATKYRTKKRFLRDFTSLHMFVLTARCNQKCTYCQVASENASAERFDMSPEVADAAVEKAFHSPSPYIKIEFQGGEPLLNYSVLQQIVEKAETLNQKYCKHLEFVVCSNLTCASDEQLEYCRKHGILVSTSLDGPREVHDACRLMEDGTGSYEKAVEGIARARDAVGPGHVSGLMAAARPSLGRFPDIVDEYVARGFRAVFFRALNPYGRARKDRDRIGYPVEDFVASYKQGLEYIVGLNQKGQVFAEQYATLILTRMLTPFSTGFVDLQSPTGAGIGCAIYDYDGNVYVSDEGRMLARTSDKTFCMGNVLGSSFRDLFGGNVIRQVVQSSCVECLPECTDCAFRMWCGADPVRNHSTQGDMEGHRPTSEFCRKNRAIIRHLLDMVIDADPEMLDVFWSWITERSLPEVETIGGEGEECVESA